MNPKHQTFILEMIKHGDKLRAYQKAYPKAKDNSAIKAAERLMRVPSIANEIAHAVAAIKNEAYNEAYQLCLAEQKTLLLSVMKKREILTQIATCEMKVGRYVKEEDGYRLVYEDPRPRDIIKAIEVDTHLEEACNRLRNTKDTQLSDFDIYIDGRPCDDPTAAVNTDIPTGLVMLPQKKKSHSKTGNKKEQNPQLAAKYMLIEERHAAILNDPVSQSFYKRLSGMYNSPQLNTISTYKQTG